MFQKMHLFQSLALLASAAFLAPLSAQQWVAKGMPGRQIRCITVDDSGRVVAGVTHQQMDGLYVAADASNTSFGAVSFSLWVDPNAIVKVSTDLFFFVGYGQNESTGGTGDGIFKLQWISEYTFTRMNTVAGPTAIASRTVTGPTRDSIYVFVSDGKSVTRGRWKGYPPLTMDSLKTPADAFGTGEPYCAALCVYGTGQLCYAGGYDKAAANPGPASLLYEARFDSMAVLKSGVNVTALAAGAKYLYVGTKTGGMLKYAEPASPGGTGTFTEVAGPSTEPVVSIAVIPGLTGDNDIVYAAVSSGVFKSAAGMSAPWQELGSLSATPSCLALGTVPGELLAGTNDGIYLYNDASPVQRPRPASEARFAAVSPRTRATLDIHVSSLDGGSVSVELYDLLGNLVDRKAAVAGYATFDRPRGPCFYQVRSGESVLRTGRIVPR